MKIFTLLLLLCLCINAQSTPLSGNYTINSAIVTGGTNFQSFTSLADTMNLNGISGNVVVTVTPGSGPYNEKVSFDSVQGTSASSTVIIDGSNEIITDLTDSTNRYIVRLQNDQYFTITNLHVIRQQASLSGFYGIHILGSGMHINITNCVIEMGQNNSTLIGGIVASGSTTSILQEGDFHDIIISHDTTIGGGYGASLFGLSTLATGIVISDNTFYDFHTNGVYIRESDSTVICRNYLDKRDQYVLSVNAIQIAQSANINAQIYDNHIKVSQTNNGTQGFRGIYLFAGTGHRVYNNVISDINLISGDVTAIEVRTTGSAPDVFFNTISIDNPLSTNGELIGIKESLNNTGTKIRNNIISITQPTTGYSGGIALGTTSTTTSAVQSDYNDFWIPNGNVAIKGLLLNPPAFMPTILDWRAVSAQDSNSLSLDPSFISFTSSIPANPLLDNMGTTVSYVSNDILGNARNVPPDMGAYEFIINGIGSSLNNEAGKVFPNPANDFLNIETGNESSIVIFNSLGKIVLKDGNKFLTTRTYDVSKFLPGIYLVRITNAHGVSCGRIVKS